MVLGMSYGELFLLIGATAALVGPKDLPKIAKTAGRLAGRGIGYAQLARGQFENVMQQSQARQVHKELQDTMAQLEAIRHEIRSISFVNPGPMTRRLMDNPPEPTSDGIDNGNDSLPEKREEELQPTKPLTKDNSFNASGLINLHSQATAYEKLAESAAFESGGLKGNTDTEKLSDEAGLLTVLPVSAESAGFLPSRKESPTGSDVLLEAVLEAEVARNAKDFFSQPQNQIQHE